MDVNKRDDIRVIAISEDMDGNIWIGTWDEGLFVINPTEEKLVNHFTATTAVYAIIKDTFGNMWFSNNQRLSKYDPLEKRILERSLRDRYAKLGGMKEASAIETTPKDTIKKTVTTKMRTIAIDTTKEN